MNSPESGKSVNTTTNPWGEWENDTVWESVSNGITWNSKETPVEQTAEKRPVNTGFEAIHDDTGGLEDSPIDSQWNIIHTESTSTNPENQSKNPVNKPVAEQETLPESQAREPEKGTETPKAPSSTYFDIVQRRAEADLKKTDNAVGDIINRKEGLYDQQQKYLRDTEALKAIKEKNEKMTLAKSVEEQKEELERRINEIRIKINLDTIEDAKAELDKIIKEKEQLEKITHRYSNEELAKAASNISDIWEEINLRKSVKEAGKNLKNAQREEAKAEKIRDKRRNVVDAFKEEQAAQQAKAERKAKRQEFEDQFGFKSFKKFLRSNQEQQVGLSDEEEELEQKYQELKKTLTGDSDKAKKPKTPAERLESSFQQERVKSDLKKLERIKDTEDARIDERLAELEDEAKEAKQYETYFPTLRERIRRLHGNGPVKTALRKIKILSYMSSSDRNAYESTPQPALAEEDKQAEAESEQPRKATITNLNQYPAEKPEAEQAAA